MENGGRTLIHRVPPTTNLFLWVNQLKALCLELLRCVGAAYGDPPPGILEYDQVFPVIVLNIQSRLVETVAPKHVHFFRHSQLFLVGIDT